VYYEFCSSISLITTFFALAPFLTCTVEMAENAVRHAVTTFQDIST
jgi:hypothetical protein